MEHLILFKNLYLIHYNGFYIVLLIYFLASDFRLHLLMTGARYGNHRSHIVWL